MSQSKTFTLLVHTNHIIMLKLALVNISTTVTKLIVSANFGPSRVHALPMAAGINVGGHYFGPRSACAALGCWHKRWWPLFLIFSSERSACDALGCWHKRRWPLF